MEEKRKHKRLDLDVTVELERINEGGITTLKFCHVDIINLSHSGIGFKSAQELEKGTYYNTKLTIWTKETIDTIIEIVRCQKTEDGYTYGAEFIGMTDTDALKIDIYQIFNEA
jgi:hypothetical protein